MAGTNTKIAIAAINIIIESLQEDDFFNIVYVSIVYVSIRLFDLIAKAKFSSIIGRVFM